MNEPDPKQVVDDAEKALWDTLGVKMTDKDEPGAMPATMEQLFAHMIRVPPFSFPDGDEVTEEDSQRMIAKFQEESLNAIGKSDHTFFKRMARAVKEDRKLQLPDRHISTTSEDPALRCYLALEDYVQEHSKLPTADELKALAKLNDQPWRRARKILKLAGKLPRKPKSGGI
jgi:hypothetical protein